VDKKTTLYIVKKKPKALDSAAFTLIFGERLQDAREETIYSRKDVADACGVTKDTVRQWEDGRACMPARYMVIVCEMLYIDPWRLLTGRGRRAPLRDLPPHLRNPNPGIRSA